MSFLNRKQHMAIYSLVELDQSRGNKGIFLPNWYSYIMICDSKMEFDRESSIHEALTLSAKI